MVVPCCNTIHYQYQLYDSESDYNNLGVYKGVSAKKKGLKQNMEKYNDFNCDILKWRGDEKSTTQTSYVSYTGGGQMSTTMASTVSTLGRRKPNRDLNCVIHRGGEKLNTFYESLTNFHNFLF